MLFILANRKNHLLLYKKIMAVLKSFLVIGIFISCASLSTQVNFYTPILTDLQTTNFSTAVKKIDQARTTEKYTQKERVLFYLDKGVVQYYNNEYEASTANLETADRYMEELFTKSISKEGLSYILNDNALDYYGEVYENLYVNIFKALNFIRQNQFDAAFVEINRVNDKLRELELKYGDYIENLNKSEDAKIKIERQSSELTSNVLAHYLSYIIYRSDQVIDDSRISHEKMVKTWEAHPDVYNFAKPACINNPPNLRGYFLNVIAFTGFAPYKKAVGAKITTYDDAIGISSVDAPIALPNIPFPGAKEGYHFKFAFPVIRSTPSNIQRIDVWIDGNLAGQLDLLEDMANVATKTFNTKRNIIYIKTVVRTVLKGLASAEAKKKLKKETKANDFWGKVMDAAVDIGVDATENADLRCWRTMPQKCYVGEFTITPGPHQVEIQFYNKNNLLIQKKTFTDYTAGRDLNLIDVVSIN